MLHAQIPPLLQKVLDGSHELGIDVAGEGMTGVIGQNADEHDGIVLHVARGAGWVGQQLADAIRGFLCGVGAGFGIVDDRGEMEVFVSFLFIAASGSGNIGVYDTLDEAYRIAARFAKRVLTVRQLDMSFVRAVYTPFP